MKLNDLLLKTVCSAVDFKNPKKNLKVAHDLIRLMIKERGMGLAANQCGIDLRVFVMKIGDEFFHCFNPEIITSSQDLIGMTEGCLSFPGERCEIVRPFSIWTRFANARGQYQEREFRGLAARCFQHELDHLNGITMHTRLSHVQS